jgi:hypothetical protein
MNPTSIINEISRLNASIPHLIEELERNSAQLKRNIANADQNWHDNVKERFFSGPITNIRQAHRTQNAAMESVSGEFRRGEKLIFSMI